MALTFHHHRLDNGLEVIAESNPDAHSMAVGFYVNTGSRDEAPNLNGVSHFLEHMMFKGSEKYSWEDVNRIFDEIGANYNAYTSQENTAYYANVLPEFAERAIEHLSHLLRPAIRTADFETEKKVILEEIAMYLDDPGHRIYESLMATHFGKHPLSMSVLGSAESIKRLKRDEMAAYFSRRYGPGNTTLAATGKVDFAKVVELAEKYCGSWKPAAAPRKQGKAKYQRHKKILTDRKLNRQYTMGMTPGPSAQDERRFARGYWRMWLGIRMGAGFTGRWWTMRSRRMRILGFIRTMDAGVFIFRWCRIRSGGSGIGDRAERAEAGEGGFERGGSGAGEEQTFDARLCWMGRCRWGGCDRLRRIGFTTGSIGRWKRIWRRWNR